MDAVLEGKEQWNLLLCLSSYVILVLYIYPEAVKIDIFLASVNIRQVLWV